MIEIVIEQITPRFSQEVELDGRTYRFTFEWNDRDASWTFNLADVDGVEHLQGVRVSVGLPLIARFRNPALPPGILEAIDTTDSNLDPLYGDLGSRVALVYTPVADLPDAFKVK